MIDQSLSEDEPAKTFPGGYKELPHEVYRHLHIIPETFIVDGHHVHVYASKNNDALPSDRQSRVYKSKDINLAEQAIRPFAKSNHLSVYQYFELLLTEIPKYINDTDLSFIGELLPWSPNVQEKLPHSSSNLFRFVTSVFY